MMQLNHIQVVGNLTRDPELRFTSIDGTQIVEFSLAVNERFSNGQDKDPHKVVTFLDVQAWGKAAENLSKLAEKGQELFVEGSLRQSNWKDAETGKSRSKIFIRADSWQFTQHKEKAPEQEKKAPEQEIER